MRDEKGLFCGSIVDIFSAFWFSDDPTCTCSIISNFQIVDKAYSSIISKTVVINFSERTFSVNFGAEFLLALHCSDCSFVLGF